MASDTVSTSNEDEADLALSWSGRWSLAHRILAVNVLTILLVALSTLYLDVFRHRLSKERTQQTRLETATAAAAMSHVPQAGWPSLLATASKVTRISEEMSAGKNSRSQSVSIAVASDRTVFTSPGFPPIS